MYWWTLGNYRPATGRQNEHEYHGKKQTDKLFAHYNTSKKYLFLLVTVQVLEKSEFRTPRK